MRVVDQIYIDGRFRTASGAEERDLINPATEEVIGRVRLGNEADAQAAIAAAKQAFKSFRHTSHAERGAMLERLHHSLLARADDLTRIAVEEFGSPVTATQVRTRYAANSCLFAKQAMESLPFETRVGTAKVVQEPLGVAAFITPWNANYTHLSKLAFALAAGCTVVIKPSELSALQTQLFLQCIHDAELPPGVVNVVNGAGPVVGAEITRHPDVAVIAFTGSTAVGKTIRRDASETMKRLTLEMGGKSAHVILDNADLAEAIPRALLIAYSNSGQACHAGTRLIVPRQRLSEVKQRILETIGTLKVGDPRQENVNIGPLVSQRQYDRVQRYIRSGIEQGAELLVGGEGRPQGLERGYFVRPTVFANVTSKMTIAQEEIFGPVLSILTYESEEEAIEIANDTVYGLAAYVSSADIQRANAIASQLVAGNVLINKLANDEPMAPFGGFKQSGLGRERGLYGLAGFLEPKAILGS